MDNGSRPARFAGAQVVTWLALALLIGSMVYFLNANAAWLKPFGRDLLHWLGTPSLSGGPSVPFGWPLWLGSVALAGLAAWAAATTSLRGTPLADDLAARLGTAIILGVALLGYASTVAVVFGRLESWILWSILAVAAISAGAAWRLLHSPKDDPSPMLTQPAAYGRPVSRALPWLGWSLAIGVVLFSIVHAVMAPVTEWDATIYHAATAQSWFANRPDPPLIFGPSVGREISANFPPLFPAVGATAYTIIGHFDDFYLRIVSPVVAVGFLLVTFAYARLHSGATVAWWVVILALGSPLLVLYTVWPTNYLLLAALTLLVLLFCELGATSGRTLPWASAGAFAGLAILTNFYGLLTLGFAALAALVWRRSWRGVQAVAIFGVVAGVVSAPWLIRNWVRLGDPLYPLGSPIFHGIGLIQPLWSAAQAEIRQNAIGQQFGDAHGVTLSLVELGTALESHYLLPCGLVLGLIIGLWRARLNDSRAAYLTAAVVLMIAAIMIPGWYWLRALLPVLPVAALLTGLALEFPSRWSQRVDEKPGGIVAFGRSLWTPALIAAALVSVITGLSLSIAGPSQGVWTTRLDASSDLMRSVRNLGSNEAQLLTDFGGDYLAWQWLNSHLGSSDKVATFEIRTYYINRPANLFYLDGLEAEPLLHLKTQAEVREYLIARSVRFIMIPRWVMPPTVTRHPAVDLLPLMNMLGKPGGFPTLATFKSTTVYGLPSDTGGS